MQQFNCLVVFNRCKENVQLVDEVNPLKWLPLTENVANSDIFEEQMKAGAGITEE